MCIICHVERMSISSISHEFMCVLVHIQSWMTWSLAKVFMCYVLVFCLPCCVFVVDPNILSPAIEFEFFLKLWSQNIKKETYEDINLTFC